MKPRLSGGGRPSRLILAGLLTAGSLTAVAVAASAAPATPTTSATVVQTNLVSDLPGVADVTDPNLVNPWGISDSTTSPFWLSDNSSGLSTLYVVPGANNAPVSVNPLAVSIPTPVALTGGAPTGTVFNTALSSGAFQITGPDKAGQTTSAPAAFLFDTEDGTILGWNPGIDPTGQFAGPNGTSTHAVIALDNSGNNFTNPDPNQQTGAVYKGLAIETSSTPIIAADPNSTALLYATNFRDAKIEVYDAKFDRVTPLPADAFRDPQLPAGYAPFNIQALNGEIYVTYARQDATNHDDAAGAHRGFVDVFNPDGSPGLPGGKVRLISRGPLDSPWGLALAPQGFAGLSAPNSDPVLLVGNFGDGRINAFDATSGSPLGQLSDPDGEPIQIDGLWALSVGNGGSGGTANTVYFTAGPFGETHGLFGSLTTAAPGSPEGPAESQVVQADLDVVQIALQQLAGDSAGGAPTSTIQADAQALNTDTTMLRRDERAYAQDAVADSTQ